MPEFLYTEGGGGRLPGDLCTRRLAQVRRRGKFLTAGAELAEMRLLMPPRKCRLPWNTAAATSYRRVAGDTRKAGRSARLLCLLCHLCRRNATLSWEALGKNTHYEGPLPLPIPPTSNGKENVLGGLSEGMLSLTLYIAPLSSLAAFGCYCLCHCTASPANDRGTWKEMGMFSWGTITSTRGGMEP